MIKRRARLAVIHSLMTILVGVGGAWWDRWRRDRDFEAFQSRVASWGGSAKRFPNMDSPFWNYRGFLGLDGVIEPLLGSDGYELSTLKGDVTREQLNDLLSVSRIRSLWIAEASRLDDEMVLGLRDPGAMRRLLLNHVNVTDRSLEAIARMPDLQVLVLVDTSVSDAAFDRLLKLPKLNNLHIGGPNIRAIRLVDHEVVDESGRPADRSGVTLGVRGWFAIEGRLGTPRDVWVLVRSEGDPPPWEAPVYGMNTGRWARGRCIEVQPGLWTFDAWVAGVPAGTSSVEVWVSISKNHLPAYLSSRLEPFSISLSPADGDGDRVAEPGRVREDGNLGAPAHPPKLKLP